MLTKRVGYAGIAILLVGALGAAPAYGLAGGTEAPSGSHGFVAKVQVGEDRSCTGALIDTQWIVTAATCFPENIPAGQTAATGAPKKATTAIIGRSDLTTTTGHAVKVVELVGHPNRNLVLGRLATRITDVTPVPIATTAAADGETLKIAGFGRTATEWVPDKLHTGLFTVDSTTGQQLNLTPQGSAAVCKGDSGGPAFREVDGAPQLLAINNASWQGGCYESTETRRGAAETRVDDLRAWITERTRFRGISAFYNYGDYRLGLWRFDHVGRPEGQKISMPWDSGVGNWDINRAKAVSGDFTGDGKPDIAAFYNYDGGNTSLWLFEDVNGAAPKPRNVWSSGSGNWEWHRGTPLAGDFDGDGTAEIASFYDYDGADTRMFVFDEIGGTVKITNPWHSGAGNWAMDRTKAVAGDFNGDGKVDIGAFYNYTGGNTSLWVFDHVATSGSPYIKSVWNSGAGNWEWHRGTPLAGDFDGDGTAEIASFYDYDGADTRMFVFDEIGGTVKITNPWHSGAGNWAMDRTKAVAGDFDDDGKVDIGAFYNYTGGNTSLWVFDHVATSGSPYIKSVWNSGAGNWEWSSGTLLAGVR